MRVVLRCALTALCGLLVLSAPLGATAVDRSPRVKPRKSLRKHSRQKSKRAKPGKSVTRGKLGEVSTFTKGTPLWVLREIFKCALDYDEASGFQCYAKHNSEINVGTTRALRHLRRYQWAHFRRWAPTYVKKAAKFAVHITRYNPKDYDGKTRELRIYLRSRQRDNPAPVMLRREGGIWKIYANSL